ncbi:hypothetical protein CMMCAS03_02660 [Clavibacter michiganensis subsp. michiganensis]|nr:hypothetical protein CMMCAS03_02660 [Clavibacter michiganensis subsp. michiganensis]
MLRPRQLRQHLQQRPRAAGGVDGREQHHERALRHDAAHERGHGGPVRLEQLGIHGRERVDHARDHVAACARPHARADAAVVRDHVHPVARARGERREQQRRLERGVEPGLVADPACGRAPRVEHQHHAAVALGPPGAHDHVLPAGCRAPVDRPHVVAAHVVAQAVELGALAAHHEGRAAVELAHAGEARGQVAARAERRQHADGTGGEERRLARGEAERAGRADRHALGAALAASRGREGEADRAALAGGDPHPVTRGGRARGRLPGVADHAAQRPGSAVGHEQHALAGLVEADPGGQAPLERDRPGARGQGEVGRHEQGDQEDPAREERVGRVRPVAERDERRDPQEEERDRAAGEGHLAARH